MLKAVLEPAFGKPDTGFHTRDVQPTEINGPAVTALLSEVGTKRTSCDVGLMSEMHVIADITNWLEML